MKVLVHHIISYEMPNNPKVGGLLIDPHGDFCDEVMRFKEAVGNDRVIEPPLLFTGPADREMQRRIAAIQGQRRPVFDYRAVIVAAEVIDLAHGVIDHRR